MIQYENRLFEAVKELNYEIKRSTSARNFRIKNGLY